MEGENDIDDLIRSVTPLYELSPEMEEIVANHAAIGLNAKSIAIALGLNQAETEAFCAAAVVVGSSVNRAIEMGRTNGYAQPMFGLKRLADGGDVEAVRELNKSQRRNRFNEIIRNMDDDEITL